jgi:hypothetical protein
MGYSADIPEQYRGAADYVNRILKGAKPGELPVQQPTKYQFIINLKTANALGLTIPVSLLARVDRGASGDIADNDEACVVRGIEAAGLHADPGTSYE